MTSDENMYIPKLLPWENAARRVDFWRARGKRPAMVTGAFDLLHAGHVELLRHAWAAGDAVIVGLRSDASIERLKGPGRPVAEFSERAALLGAIGWVDLVVPFPLPHCADETPAGLLELLRPAVLLTGSPRGRKLPGAEFCGRVEHVPHAWQISTDVRIATIESAGLLKFLAREKPRGPSCQPRGVRGCQTPIIPPRLLPP